MNKTHGERKGFTQSRRTKGAETLVLYCRNQVRFAYDLGSSLTAKRPPPPLLPAAFGNVTLPRGEAEVEVHGYHFKMYLPSYTVLNHLAGVEETGAPGVGRLAGCGIV